MKRFIYTIVFLFPFLVSSQTTSENYIKSTTYKQATISTITNPDSNVANVSISYFDGLGRPIQQIAHKQSASGNDIITTVGYDEFGRQSKDFLPFTNASPSLSYNANASSEQLSYYNNPSFENTTNPYSEKQFDFSPLNRVMKQSAPGNDWSMGSGHEIKFEYHLNTVSDSVVKFKVERIYTSSGVYQYTLKHQGVYVDNSLYKTITKDENWVSGVNNTVEEYKDNLGKVILKRSYNNGERYNTYYVYDEIGNLCYVLPPLFDTSNCQIVTATPYNVPNSTATISTASAPFSGGGSITINVSNNVLTANFSGGFSGIFIENYSFYINNPSLYNIEIGNVGTVGVSEYKAYIENGYLKFSRVSGTSPITGFSLNRTIALSTLTYPVSSVNTQFLDGLCYQYKYDNRNRLVEKKLPGKQWEFIVYDKLDRVVATGPALSPFTNPTGNGWMISKYDVFNRVVYTGWMPTTFTSTSRSALQTQYASATANFNETKIATTANSTVGGIAFRYTNVAIPVSGYHILTVNYYDDYNFPNAPTIPTTVEGQTVFYNSTVKPKGLPTGTYVRVPETSILYKNELSYILYDEKARPIRNYTTNYLGGFTQIDTKLDWAGKALYTLTTHKRITSSTVVTVKEAFEYTPQDRLLKHTHQINGGTIQLLAKNEYDELGKLIVKRVGGTDLTGTNPLQKVDYNYNVRGWLKGINDTSNLTETTVNSDLFSFKINYNTVENIGDYTGTSLYNGNISETYWRTSSDAVLRKYGYQYDNLNRMTNSIYQKPENAVVVTNSYNESLSYDKNGNIMSLQRNGALDDNVYPIQIDDLVYNYNTTGNKPNCLLNVTDNSNDPAGFKDGANTDDDYSYDNNGNMIFDKNKDIINITYNHLNLPIRILFGNGNYIEYLYNALGQKLKKTIREATVSNNTEYLSGFQYKNEELKIFHHAEGYVNLTLGKYNELFFNYAFNYVDHLGNIRLTYGVDPSTNVLKIMEENHYYPFGLKHTNYNSQYNVFVRKAEEEQVRIKYVPHVESFYKYRYNSKEFQDELGLNLYAYGYRHYDPAIARWTTMDPLLNDLKFSFDDNDVDEDDEDEIYEALITKLETGDGIFNTDNLNPYGYGYNNPISFDDPDGRCPVCIYVVAALLYSEFANAPTGNAKQDAQNYNNAKPLRTIASETVLKRGGNILNGTAGKPGSSPGISPGKSKKTEKTYQTYTKKNEKTGETYSGRTSGKGTPKENVAKRDANHHKNKEGFGPAKLDKSSKNKDAIRGREQKLIKKNGGAKSEGGTSGNSINGVGPKNPNAKKYDAAAKKEFGN